MGGVHTGSMIDKQFGSWTVIAADSPGRWLCKCACGTTLVKRTADLSKALMCWSCHLRRMRDRNRAFKHTRKHGLSSTLEYKTWVTMRHRCSCTREDHVCFPCYGAKGIKVCPEWGTLEGGFERFLKYMGTRPADKDSIDRIDSNKNYEPGNVRWATNDEQARNRSNNRKISEVILTDAANQAGIKPGTAFSRVSRGWSADNAVSEPVDTRYHKLSASKEWTEADDEVVRTSATAEEAADKLGRSWEAVSTRACRIGKIFGKRWTPEDDAVVLAHPAQEAARLLNLSPNAVRTRKCRLKKRIGA